MNSKASCVKSHFHHTVVIDLPLLKLHGKYFLHKYQLHFIYKTRKLRCP